MPRKRDPGALRPVKIRRNWLPHAEGSALIEQGGTRVLCAASVDDGAPPFREGRGGWVAAEYGMLPRSTHTRMKREAVRGRQGGRTVEIGRLIGRALRAAVDMESLGDVTVTVDCDVLQADGGTRCASITGGMVALVDALRWMKRERLLAADPLKHMVAAVSVGIVDGVPTLDLDYALDSAAEVDMNVVMTASGRYVELQGTAEGETFSEKQLNALKRLARDGIDELIAVQKRCLRMK